MMRQVWVMVMVILVNFQSSLQGKGDEVVIKATSPGCYKNKIASVVVNGTDYALGFDGISLVVIETERFRVYRENINDRVKSVNATLKNYLTEQVTSPGTIVVFSTQDTCFGDFELWFNTLKDVNGFHTDTFSFDKEDTTVLVFGCYGNCPGVIKGNLPASKFGDEFETLEIEMTVSVNNGPAKSVTSASSSTTVIIIVVIVCLVILFILVILYCLWRRNRKIKFCFHCFENRFAGKRDEEERMGLSVNDVDVAQRNSHYTPIGSCLIQEDDNTYTTLKKKEIPKNYDERECKQNIYYTTQEKDTLNVVHRQTSNDLYEPLAGNNNLQINAPPRYEETETSESDTNASNYNALDSDVSKVSPTDIFIDKGADESVIYKTPSNTSKAGGPESVIYKTPSNASGNSNTEEQHYHVPNQIGCEIQAHDQIPSSAGHGRVMFKRGEQTSSASKSGYHTPTNILPNQSDNTIYSSPNNTLNPDAQPLEFKSSPGTSRRMFNQEDEDEDAGDFASYVQINENEPIYKKPSNVLKHDPPAGMVSQNIYHKPKNTENDNGEDNVYDPIEIHDGRPSKDDSNDDNANYENLRLLGKK